MEEIRKNIIKLGESLNVIESKKVITNYIVIDSIMLHEDFVKYTEKTINENDKFLIGELYGTKIYLDSNLAYHQKRIYDFDMNVLLDLTNTKLNI